MARAFERPTNNYLARSPSVVSGLPFSMACWFNLIDNATSDYFVSVSDASTADDRITFYVPFTTDVVYLAWNPQGLNNSAVSTATVTYDIWQHACGVVAAPNDLRVYLDGGHKGVGVVAGGAMLWENIDTTSIGALVWNNTVGGWVDGALAEVAIWNVALYDWEAARLAARWSPLYVRPQNLIAYYPLWGHEDETIIYGRYKMTPYNNPDIVAHPFIRMPPRGDLLWNFVKPQYRPMRWWPYAPEAAVLAAKTSYVSII